MEYTQAIVCPGSWRMPTDTHWTIPDHDESLDIQTTGYGWNTFTRIRGLVISRLWDPKRSGICTHGYVLGYRNLQRFRECGYQQCGRVSLAGEWYPAVTGTQLFERDDGALIRVEALFVTWRPESCGA
jgi:hypothetical protein